MIFTEKQVEVYCLRQYMAADYCSLPNGHDGECKTRGGVTWHE